MRSLVLPPEIADFVENRFCRMLWTEKGLTASATTGEILFQNATCRIEEFGGGSFDLFSDPALRVSVSGTALLFRADLADLELKLSCSLDGRVIRLALEIRNAGSSAFRMGDVSILHFERAAGAVSHLLADPCDVFSLGALTGDTCEMWSKENGNKRAFAMRLNQDEPHCKTDNIVALRPVFPGELTAESTFSFDRIAEGACGFAIDLDGGTARARIAYRGTVLPPGATRRLPVLTMDGLSSVDEALEAAADCVVEIYRPPVPSQVASGWCSWYYYYPHVTENDILDNLRYLAANRERIPCDYVQIDDGYQLHWGDWLLPGAKFPHDMAWLAREIKALGFKPGIWVAPLIMTVQSHLFRDHPDWAMRDMETGEVLTMQGWSPAGENPWVILDGTHPEFLAHLRKIFSVMAHEWNYEYFKLDATAFAAGSGVRHDPAKTGIEAVRMVMEAIREAIGPEKYILGCAVPFGSAIGLVNSERVSDDVSTAFLPEDNCCPIKGSMPQSIHRSFIHGKWWHNDPDCVLVRSQGTPHNETLNLQGMSLEEARFFVTVVGLTQGVQMLGENMMLLEEERLFLLDAIQPMMPHPARPLDLFLPRPEQLLCETAFGKVLGLLNWDDVPKTFSLNLADIDAAMTPVEVFEIWTKTHRGHLNGATLDIEVPAHGSRIVLLRPAEERPSFLGFDGHISGGGALLDDENWNDADSTLSLQFQANREGEISILVPEGWRVVDSELQRRTGRQWTLPLSKGTHRLALAFEAEAGSLLSV